MYSFVTPSNGLGHADGVTFYVSEVSYTVDGNSYAMFAPLEPIVCSINFFDKFRTEIDNAISNGTDLQLPTSSSFYGAANIYDGTMGTPGNRLGYTGFRIIVSQNSQLIRIMHGFCNTSGTMQSPHYVDVTFADYLTGAPLYHDYPGRLYFMVKKKRDLSEYPPPGFNGTNELLYCLGPITGWVGTWEGPSSTWPNGVMRYRYLPDKILPDTVLIARYDQLGSSFHRNVHSVTVEECLMNQTESMGSATNEMHFSTNTGIYAGTNGEIDPNPDPPGPTPPGPHIDPNYDPHTEPGDNPNPRPGGQNREYDPVPIPPKPEITAVGAGFTTLYRPTAAILKLLAGELYSDNTIQIISNFFSDPYDMIAGLSIVPFIPPVSGRAKHRIGLFESTISMDVISNQFVDINCGDILVDPYYNSFLDQSPYTRLLIWLPYIGYQEIDPDEVMGHMLNVTYRCDCLSGACTAFVNTGVVGETGPQIPRVLAQFSGNCSVQIPTAAASYDNLVSSAINILTTAANAGIGQASVAASMAAMSSGKHPATQAQLDSVQAHADVSVSQSLVGCAGDVVRAMKPSVTRNGTPGSTAGYMGVQKPYLIKIVPRSSIPDDETFMNMRGYPSNKVGTLSDYSGYCEVEDIQLNDVPATIGEINEIYALLKGGVIL